jgi:hypothetical protein
LRRLIGMERSLSRLLPHQARIWTATGAVKLGQEREQS